MKIQIHSAELHRAATWIAKIAPQKAAAPITGGVLIDAGDTLTLSATDFDRFGTVALPEAITPDGGRAVISARLMAAITKTLPQDAEVLLEDVDRGLEVCCGRSRWVLPTLDVAEWPTFPCPGEPVGHIDATSFARGLSRVLPAASTDIATPYITGVELRLDRQQLGLATTDRYRLAATELPWQPSLRDDTPHTVNVPAELLRAVVTATADHAGTVSLHADSNTISITTGSHTITGRLIDGAFPRWQLLIPTEITTTISVATTPLALAVTQVGAIGDDRHTILRLDLTDGGVGISDQGDAHSFVRCRSFTGDSITVHVRDTYLRDALTSCDSSTVVLRLTASPHKPFIVVPGDDDGHTTDEAYRHLLMTVRGTGGAR